nr:ANTAR domain-containing protein [Nocardioides perillae]
MSTGSRRLLETVAAAAAGSVERLAHQQDVARALETRSVIGQAIGIVMERYDLTHDRAWDYLVRQASTREVKLALVAREVVDRRDQGAAESGVDPAEPVG